MAINDCLNMKVYASEILNLSVEKMNSIVEDIIDLLQEILGKLPLGKFSPINLPTGEFPHGKFPPRKFLPGIFPLMFFIISAWVFEICCFFVIATVFIDIT